jgi:hypothetical protein
MTSTGLPANGDPGNEEAREPKGDELMFITPKEARKKWGDRIWEMEGVTWLFNDGQCQFDTRYDRQIRWTNLVESFLFQSSIITIISLRNCSWESGEHIPRWGKTLRRMELPHFPHPLEPGSSV